MVIFHSYVSDLPMKNCDFPMNNCDFPEFFLCLPEGSHRLCGSEGADSVPSIAVALDGAQRHQRCGVSWMMRMGQNLLYIYIYSCTIYVYCIIYVSITQYYAYIINLGD